MSLRVKRGPTESWSLGPERVKFQKYGANGSDSVIHCEDTKITFTIGTTSASDFYNVGIKNTGIWLIRSSDNFTLPQGKYKIKMSSTVQSGYEGDDWYVYFTDKNGAAISVTTPSGSSRALGGNCGNLGVNYVYLDVGPEGITLCSFCIWETLEEARVDLELSIRKVDEQETLLPGQLGVAFSQVSSNTTDVAAFLKIGTSIGSAAQMDNEPRPWKDLFYVGQVLPAEMYGTTLPTSGVDGQIFYKKVT